MTEAVRKKNRMKLFRSIYNDKTVQFNDKPSISNANNSIYSQKLENHLKRAIKKHENTKKLRTILRSRKCKRSHLRETLKPMMNKTMPSGGFFSKDRSKSENPKKKVNFKNNERSLSSRPKTSRIKELKMNKTYSGFNEKRSKSTRNYNLRKMNSTDYGVRKRANSFKIRRKRMKLPREFQEELEKKQFRTQNFNSLPPSKIIDFIVKNRMSVMKNYKLFEGLKKLRNKNLLQKKKLSARKIEKASFKGYVYNDYHNSNTNNGYSRNVGGLFFYR